MRRMDIIYSLLGAIAITGIIFNLFGIFLPKSLDEKSSVYVSFVGTAILILIITSFTIGIEKGFLMYIPVLFIWFVLDLIRMSKNTEINKTKKTPLD